MPSAILASLVRARSPSPSFSCGPAPARAVVPRPGTPGCLGPASACTARSSPPRRPARGPSSLPSFAVCTAHCRSLGPPRALPGCSTFCTGTLAANTAGTRGRHPAAAASSQPPLEPRPWAAYGTPALLVRHALAAAPAAPLGRPRPPGAARAPFAPAEPPRLSSPSEPSGRPVAARRAAQAKEGGGKGEEVGQRFLGSVSVRAEISIFFRRVLCGASNPCAQAHKHQSGPLRPAPPWTAAGGAHPRPPGWPERPGPARSHYPISNSKRERNMGSMAPTPCPLGGGSGTRPGAGDSVRPGSWQRNIPWPEQPGPRLSQ